MNENHRLGVVLCVLTMLILQGCESKYHSHVQANFGSTVDLHREEQHIAVLPFTDAEGESAEIWGCLVSTAPNNGETVAGILTDMLITIPSYNIVERSKLKNLLDEHGLAAAEFVEEKGVREVGKLLGASAIVVGNVGKFEQTTGIVTECIVDFSVRCLDVDTGEVIWSASPSVYGKGTTTLITIRACEKIAQQIADRLK